VQQQRGREQRDDEADRALERQRLARQPHPSGDQRAQPDHRGEVEAVRADEHADPYVMGALDQRDQGRGDLRPVCGHRRQQPDQRLGEAEPHAEPVEPAGEQPRRTERDRQRDTEDWDCEGGGHATPRSARDMPTSLPGSPRADVT